MLAQWVPLHAVSCSNLIETGGCAESREIPLRVTQTCCGCCTREMVLSSPFCFSSIRVNALSLAWAAHVPSDRRCTARSLSLE